MSSSRFVRKVPISPAVPIMDSPRHASPLRRTRKLKLSLNDRSFIAGHRSIRRHPRSERTNERTNAELHASRTTARARLPAPPMTTHRLWHSAWMGKVDGWMGGWIDGSMDRRREAYETRGRDFCAFNRVEYLVGSDRALRAISLENKIYSKLTDVPSCNLPPNKKNCEISRCIILTSLASEFFTILFVPILSCLVNICSVYILDR